MAVTGHCPHGRPHGRVGCMDCMDEHISSLESDNRVMRDALKRIELGCSFPEDDVQRAIVKVAREALDND